MNGGEKTYIEVKDCVPEKLYTNNREYYKCPNGGPNGFCHDCIDYYTSTNNVKVYI